MRFNAERKAVQNRVMLYLFALLIPVMGSCARLTSISASRNTEKAFSIVALHFDEEVSYTVLETKEGRSLRLSLPDCQIETSAAEKLTSLRDACIQSVQWEAHSDELVLVVTFRGQMKPLVWETRNPFSLVLDISPAEVQGSSTQPQSSLKKDSETKKEPAVEVTEPPAEKTVAAAQPEKEVKASPQSIKPKTNEKKEEKKIILPDAESPQGHFLTGSMLRQKGQYSEALLHFQQARKDPDLYARSTAEIANIYHQIGSVEKEILEWENLFRHVTQETQSQRVIAGSYTGTIEHQGNAGISQDQHDANSEVHSVTSKKSGSVLIYLSVGMVLILSVILFRFYSKKKEMRLYSLLHTEEESAEEEKVPAKPEPVAKQEEKAPPETSEKTEIKEDSDWGKKPTVESALPPLDDILSEIPTKDKKKDGPIKPAEETAREVFSLSEQGLSIQEIAEKLGLGQDEVRLILNLQREEEPAEVEG